MHQRYAYQLSPRTVRLVCLVGGPVFAVSAYAIFAGWGLSMAGSVQVDAGIARYFYAGFALLGLTILGWGAWMLKIGTRFLEIDSEGVTLPATLMSKAMIKVPFGQIQSLQLTEYNDIQVLHISHAGGTSKLGSPHFESYESFLELTDKLHDAVEPAD